MSTFQYASIAARYVSALFSRHTDTAAQDAMAQGLQAWAEAMQPGKPLAQAVSNPALSRQALETLMAGLAKKHGATPEVTALLVLLAKQRRLEALGEITRQYQARLRGLRGYKQAEVISAQALSEAQKRPIQEALGAKTDIQWRQDANLLGGFVLEMEGRTLDLSLAGRLREAARGLGVSGVAAH